jgi:phosphohistidine phosphatase
MSCAATFKKEAHLELFLLRHARPEAPNSERYSDDRQRPLTEAGRQEHRRVIRAVVPLLQPLDYILSSPLVRARQTADLTAEGLSWNGQVQETSVLGEAYTTGAVLALLDNYAPQARLLCIGHAPDMGRLAAFLLDGEGRSRIDFQQGALMGLSFIGVPMPGRGTLCFFLRPADVLRMQDA